LSDSHLSSHRQWSHWPNFSQFQRQAKELLKSYRAGEAGAVAKNLLAPTQPCPYFMLSG
jgi:hypothetical protein